MAVVNSSTFNFRETVNQFLRVESVNAWETTYEVIDEVSKEAVKKLKAASPKRPANGAKYSKGWTRTLDKGRTTAGAKVHGKHGTYQLAHLLEYGHAVRGGGRSREIVHIEPVEQWAIDEAQERIIKRLSGL